jgi:3-hydroxyisobutyrate dehydrogenase-like beta-hydroxyacid dehydrogenase
VVVSLTCAHEAEAALLAALPGIRPGAIYADLNTASSAGKVRLAGLAAGAGAAFADVALMAPVPGKGLRTPMLAAGRPGRPRRPGRPLASQPDGTGSAHRACPVPGC